MPAVMHEMFEEKNDMKIVLSEEVYKRLSGCINLCGFNMGKSNNEYGTILYGYKREDGSIYFERPSENDDYVPSSGTFKLGEGMQEELIQNVVTSPRYNCFAHIHTHPYLPKENGGSRFTSQEDINYYKSKFNFSKVEKEGGVLSFGGLLTVGGENTAETDDISFVQYDANTGKMYHIPNIFVVIDRKEVPLERVDAEFEINGSKIPFKRTLFQTEKEQDLAINPSEISELTKVTAKKKPGIISNALGKIKRIFSRVLDKEKNRDD